MQLLRRLQLKLGSDFISFKVFDRFISATKSLYFTDMLGSYRIYSKQAYKLSFTLVGKTQTNHHPDQPDLVICSLFANFFQNKILELSIYFQTSTRYD